MRCRSAGGVRRQGADRDRDAGLGRLADLLDGLLDHRVERLGVLPQLLGRAGEGLGDARAELGLEHRKHGANAPAPVHRGRCRCAGRPRPRARHRRRTARVVDRRMPRSGRRRLPDAAAMPCRLAAPEPRASPSSTVSAWSSRVWPTSTATAPVSATRGIQRRVAGVARGRLGPAGIRRRSDLDTTHQHGIEAEVAGLVRGARRHGGRALLQAVVDDHGAGAQSRSAAPRRQSQQRGRESRRRRSARRGAEHPSSKEQARRCRHATARRTSAMAGVSRGRRSDSIQ